MSPRDAERSPAWTAATAHTVDGVQFAVNGNRDPRRATTLRDAIAELSAEGALPIRRHRNGPGRVFLVGGGPGDPDLLTTRARRVLSLADVVVTDRLAPVAVLFTLAEDVEVVDTARLPVGMPEINDLLVDRPSGTRRRPPGGRSVHLGRGGGGSVHRGGGRSRSCRASLGHLGSAAAGSVRTAPVDPVLVLSGTTVRMRSCAGRRPRPGTPRWCC
jgi:uroporphyrin-III C-methyltransferase/precorrin-2 dehydrogenase/sirohydrochlorin ferrochelatase